LVAGVEVKATFNAALTGIYEAKMVYGTPEEVDVLKARAPGRP
jgi:hypothetical protein